MQRWFASDVHLDDGAEHELRTAAFLGWLRRAARSADEIYLLGDLFEMWIGDDDDAPLARRARAALSEASATARISFLVGNRDFLVGDTFARGTGIELLGDVARLEDGTLVCHGDTLCTDDAAYQQLRTVLHSPEWRRETLAKPIAERRAMGDALRAASREANAFKADNIMDVNAATVSTTCATHAVRVLVHGHTHRPGIERSSDWDRYTLGAWERCGWWLESEQRGTEQTWRLRCAPLALLAE
ncbi:MAG: UDP-2,3-diacylglucosamine diphosphatase [Planctomycetota bacterium]